VEEVKLPPKGSEKEIVHLLGVVMDKRKTKKQSAKATLAEVTKEMAKPRVAGSAREQRPVSSEQSSSRGERHLEVNYELAARSRHHSQRNPTF